MSVFFPKDIWFNVAEVEASGMVEIEVKKVRENCCNFRFASQKYFVYQQELH